MATAQRTVDFLLEQLTGAGANNYLCVPDDRWEETDWIVRLIRAAADSLPVPKPKTRKPKTAQ